MRIRSGFVSNSSSTSFLIVSADDLTHDSFLELMGVGTESALAPIFSDLFDRLMSSGRAVDFRQAGSVPLERWMWGRELSPELHARVAKAKELGLRVYYGTLDSDGDPVESFFCTEAFEAENERVYFYGLNCAW